MYRQTKSVDWCQCCMRGVSLSYAEGSSDFFGNHNTPQIVHSSDNSCCGALCAPWRERLRCTQTAATRSGRSSRHRRRSHRSPSCFLISFSFSAHRLPPALVREVAARRADGGSKTPPVSFADSPLLKAGAKAAPTIVLQITLLVSVN